MKNAVAVKAFVKKKSEMETKTAQEENLRQEYHNYDKFELSHQIYYY